MDEATTPHETKTPNHLAGETSPYLLQHAYNPVDWYPWGPEALEKARRENKPIFLSIGYSACHWCHVMEHESFEDPGIARILKEHFVSIKVDREERPDLDQIYMNAVQVMTGRGGWPMSAFLTPDLEPFYGGTYFPPEDRFGMPGFRRVLEAVIEAWQNRQADLKQQSRQLTDQLRALSALPSQPGALGPDLLENAFHALDRQFDDRHGGFGGAPKFPHAMDLRLLLRTWWRTGQERALDMVRITLDKMSTGGIYDHLGGGFHRYSVDERWLVPHFEKMLYDNALLSLAYLEAYQATGEARYGQVARETLDYILREMTAPEGGFYSTQDADSEGEEGQYYIWKKAEIDQVLGPDLSRIFCYCYDVTDIGNWEGKNVLNCPKTQVQAARLLDIPEEKLDTQLAEARSRLFDVRQKRVPPGRDEKVLADWNALMIDACALAGRVLGEPRYLEAAAAAADFLLNRLRTADGKLLHSYKDGRARFNAYADDYAFLTNALVTLYETTFDPRWLEAAQSLAEKMVELFWDEENDGFFFTATDHEWLIARVKATYDNATPSANSVASLALLRLAKLAGVDRWREYAERTLNALRTVMSQLPTACSQAIATLDFSLGPVTEIAIVGDPHQPETIQMVQEVYQRFLPNKVVALSDLPGGQASTVGIPLLEGKGAADGRPTLYLCENFTCQTPSVGLEAAVKAMEERSPPHVKHADTG